MKLRILVLNIHKRDENIHGDSFCYVIKWTLIDVCMGMCAAYAWTYISG